VPSDYGLPYEELSLRTSDGVTIRAYLLLQRKDLTQTENIDIAEQQEVRSILKNLVFGFQKHASRSTRPLDPPSSCSMAMEGIMVTVYLSLKSFTSRCGVMFSWSHIEGA
jgi:hypothetical protein